jgi:predicted transposase YbfD/YdcC
VTRQREIKGKRSQETAYYMTSSTQDIKILAHVIRHHWSIENSQHWILDMAFREDESTIYAQDGAKNMALFRRALLNLIKLHPLKDSVAGKMMRAGWDDEFRAEILFGQKVTKV